MGCNLVSDTRQKSWENLVLTYEEYLAWISVLFSRKKELTFLSSSAIENLPDPDRADIVQFFAAARS